MSTSYEPPFDDRPRDFAGWRRVKRLAILFGVSALAMLIGFLALWNSFFVFVRPGQHLVVIAKRGEPLPANQVLAQAGQEGVQARVYGEGWHFVWPVIYATERHPNT